MLIICSPSVHKTAQYISSVFNGNTAKFATSLVLIAAISTKKLCSVGPHARQNLSRSDTKDTNILWKPIVDILYLELNSIERYISTQKLFVFLSSNNVIGKLIPTMTIQSKVVLVNKGTKQYINWRRCSRNNIYSADSALNK